MAHKNKHWTYLLILDALTKAGIVDGGVIKQMTGLESSEVHKYSYELVALGAIEKIINSEGEHPKNKLTNKGVTMRTLLEKLHDLMGDT